MQQPDEQTTQQENDAAVPATDIQGNVLPGPVDDASVELLDTVEAVDDASVDELPDTVEAMDGAVDEPVTVTRTTTITNSSDGSVIQESSASRPSDLDSSEAAEDEFIQELLASGWKSRGRPNPPSAVATQQDPPAANQFGKTAKEDHSSKTSKKSKANEQPPPPAKKVALGKRS